MPTPQALFALFLFLACTSFAQAQEEALPSRPVIINGSQHPELIPDSLAYRIVFGHLIIYIGDPETEKRNFSKVGLSGDDTETLYRVMKVYKENFEAITKTYNDALADAKKITASPMLPILRLFGRTAPNWFAPRAKISMEHSPPKASPIFTITSSHKK